MEINKETITILTIFGIFLALGSFVIQPFQQNTAGFATNTTVSNTLASQALPATGQSFLGSGDGVITTSYVISIIVVFALIVAILYGIWHFLSQKPHNKIPLPKTAYVPPRTESQTLPQQKPIPVPSYRPVVPKLEPKKASIMPAKKSAAKGQRVEAVEILAYIDKMRLLGFPEKFILDKLVEAGWELAFARELLDS